MTKVESLKAKSEKKEAELKDLKKQLKEEELTEQRARELVEKLEGKKDEIRDAIQGVFNSAGLSLPKDKHIDIAADETGLSVNILDVKPARIKAGGGKGTPVTVNGVEYPSGAEACRQLGIDYAGDSPIRALERAKKNGKVGTVEKIAA